MRRVWGIGFCLIMSVMLFTGCSSTELEERCFPQLAAVGYEDEQVSYALVFPRVGSSGQQEPKINEIKVPTAYAKDFADARKEYEGHLNKLADYNHLKVLVLEDDFLEEKQVYEQMLQLLAKQEDFPRNTIVCVVDDMEELLEIEKNLPQDMGTYLEEYLKNHEEKKAHLLTLGDLIDEQANEELVLYVPYLEVEDNYVQWGGYYAIGVYES